MDTIVLCLNGGSSSLKFSVFELAGRAEERLVTGAVEGVGTREGRAWVRGGADSERKGAFADAAAALNEAFELIDAQRIPKPHVVGHRVVHGGPDHTAPAVVDADVLASLKEAIPIAPLHMPAAIAAIEAMSRRVPGLMQVVCFDTAFHRTLPEVARRLPIPEVLHRTGVRRYGFHGLSYEYVMSVLGPGRPERIVIAHLGNGASLVAVKDGSSVDTTMGFTPAGGILMGTRTGDLDPGVLLYLARERGYSLDALDTLVEHSSGLLAIGGTSDVKTLLERAPKDERARLAIEAFSYAVKKAVAALAAAMGGIDLLVFTGGIGEHAGAIRARTCRGLGFLGITLDEARNSAGAGVISTPDSRCTVRVIATDEELVIARHAAALLGRGASPET